ncbi:MAG: vicibactin biosynthesis non-ribosomal peptide synthetase, partial [Streptococcus salivarius]
MDEQNYNLEQSIAELDKLSDLSTKETDKTACEALAEKARIIYEQHPESEDIALRYVKTLSNSADKQTEIE